MLTVKSKLLLLSRYYWLILLVFIAFVVSFVLYVQAEKAIDRANDARHASILLAGELRQSSDDLTRMVRTYVVTGDPVYQQHYREILAIREGKAPRPLDYQNIYWDLVLDDAHRPQAASAAPSLLQRMRAAGFTPEEMARLAEAKAKSDALTRTEWAAMALVASAPALDSPQRQQAIRMLHDAAYHRAKAAIMQPIAEFNRLSAQRTLQAVEDAERYALQLRCIFVAFGLLLLPLLWGQRRNLLNVLGGSVTELHSSISRLGSGDFSQPVPLGSYSRHSVMGWLAETRDKLQRLDAARRQADAHNQRLTGLYNALSQCNQAIVRSRTQLELFERMCQAAVEHGGMKMVWVGLLDEEARHIRPLCADGSGTEYLVDLPLATAAADPLSQGPTGRAVQTGLAQWCQDFQHDPATAPWHDRAMLYGWGASAALPLQCNGRIIGALTLYSGEPHAFDEAARMLIEEMVMDLDYALDSFQREQERQAANTALQLSEQRLRTIIETEPECIKVVGSAGQLLEMNRAGMAMLQADSLQQIQQLGLMHFVLPEYHAAFMQLHQQVMSGQSATLEFEICGLHGQRRWLETHAAPMRDEGGSISMLLAITRDITLRKQNEQHIRYLAHYDVLTGLPNRVMLEEQAERILQQAARQQQAQALIFLDLDHFKDINDSLGHSVGDALLVQLAARLRRVLPDGALVSRLGGDEFVLLLPDSDAALAEALARQLLDDIARPYQVAPYDLNVSASIGIALYPQDGRDLETLSRRADAAMYLAKKAGRSCFRFYTTAIQEKAARHLQLVNALRVALEQQQLSIHYQPQLSMADGRLVGAEALLRWAHPELGHISPAEFIPVAEDCGLILPLGEWVLRHAVRQARQWREQGLELVMAVNLSAVQFRQPDLPALVARILQEEGLPASALELELTEGVAMYDPQQAIAVMNALHEQGVRMSIDDFGTGYSSLNLLKQFRVYKLKIDQSFVRDIVTDPEDRAIVAAIIDMAENLGLLTIAEGVETGEQLSWLRAQGCDELQGYLFSRPLPAAAFAAYAQQHQPATALLRS
ncbi:putative bifunctional diguanylate cyclase/phosphodiesterase [Aquitalea magnusonii]|uniref:Diguanylate cyclase/phosphodiesterase with PAS/PAC sensor(S) n=1 Tax=Aquitalea magnusonii TaxID=332411 RepID=A0A318IYT1_9NEIS|nr:EAL domain-containing protein [Aquitalea magnusonii]PXX40083.1 diguanylate cyclase/phosphodiesterase with PAS/PAC sensor(s) [Aquitalea magnusonii]